MRINITVRILATTEHRIEWKFLILQEQNVVDFSPEYNRGSGSIASQKYVHIK